MRVCLLVLAIAMVGCGAPTSPSAPSSGAVATSSPTVAGTVNEVDGGPIAGAKVTVLPAGPVTFTDVSGSFVVPTATVGLLRFEQDGYETRDWALPQVMGTAVKALLQRSVVVSDRSSLSVVLSPADLPSYVGEVYESDYCSPCKLIRLRATVPHEIKVVLRWSGEIPLQLWALAGVVKGAAQPSESELTVLVTTGAGDTVLHVGLPLKDRTPQKIQQPVAFELTTSVP